MLIYWINKTKTDSIKYSLYKSELKGKNSISEITKGLSFRDTRAN